MKDRKTRSEEQKRIASFFEGLEFATRVHDNEFGGPGNNGIKFVRHDGYTYSVRLGAVTLTLKCSIDADETRLP